MFLTMLLVSFFVTICVASAVSYAFYKPIKGILSRIIADPISDAWLRYMNFAIIVVGVSAGIRIYDLEKYITTGASEGVEKPFILTQDRWIFEIYRSIIECLQGIAWMLLVFFLMALIAYVIVVNRTPKLPKD